ncbi:MAG: hypothetical protein IPM50_02875 [Acidobacteriota bacterium]|nr:MAG: hypothetical protein IPM50_02875 [Acidobacteriota bacterium]
MSGKSLKWFGIGLILVTGIIHFYDAPDAFGEATYKGILFALNGIGVFVAAYGILRGAAWGWILGLLIAGGAIFAYVVSRTVGMPGLPIDDWLEPLGILSLVVEGLFVLPAIYALRVANKRNVT